MPYKFPPSSRCDAGRTAEEYGESRCPHAAARASAFERRRLQRFAMICNDFYNGSATIYNDVMIFGFFNEYLAYFVVFVNSYM